MCTVLENIEFAVLRTEFWHHLFCHKDARKCMFAIQPKSNIRAIHTPNTGAISDYFGSTSAKYRSDIGPTPDRPRQHWGFIGAISAYFGAISAADIAPT